MRTVLERIHTWALAAALVALAAAPALAQEPGAGRPPGGPGPWGYGYGHPMMWGGWGGGGGWMIASGFLHILVLVGIIVVVLALVRGFRHGGCPYHRHGSSDAITQLDGRYVRGEIGRDEYLEKKRDLSGR